jgi:hypothetical protein
MMVVLLTMFTITVTAISYNVTEVHDGIYRVVISWSPSAPQLSQHTPTDVVLACNKTAVLRDTTEGTAATQLEHTVLLCRQGATLWEL